MGERFEYKAQNVFTSDDNLLFRVASEASSFGQEGWRLHSLLAEEGVARLLFERQVLDDEWTHSGMGIFSDGGTVVAFDEDPDMDHFAGEPVPEEWRNHAYRLAELNPQAWEHPMNPGQGGQACWASICRDYEYMQNDPSCMVRAIGGYELIKDGEGAIRLLINPAVLWGE